MKTLINRELAVIFAVMALATMAMAVLNPILPLFLTSNKITPDVIGLMLAVVNVGMVFGEPSGGWLADKVGLKTPMLIGTFLCAPVVLCFVFTHSIAPFFMIFIFWGIFRSAVFGPARGFIGKTSALSNKAMIMSIYMTTITLSRSLGSLFSGYIADSRFGYKGDFYLAAALSVVAGIILISGFKNMPLWKPLPNEGGKYITEKPARVKMTAIFRPIIFQCIVAMTFFIAIGVNSFLPLVATEIVKVDASKVGLLYTVGGLVSAALFIPMGWLADRRDKKWLMIFGLLFSAANLAGIAYAKQYWLLVLLQVVGNVGFAMFTPAAISMLSNNAPGHGQGTAFGIYGASEDIGIILGSGVGGFVWTAGGPMALYLMGAGFVMLGAILCLGLVRDSAKNKGSISPPQDPAPASR